MRAATGSQWSSMSGVTCALFGWMNTRLLRSGPSLAVSPHMPAGPLGAGCSSQGGEITKVCTSSWVAYWVRYVLILQMLYNAKRHYLETEAMWAMKVSWSSIMTPRFLAVLDGARDKESVLM